MLSGIGRSVVAVISLGMLFPAAVALSKIAEVTLERLVELADCVIIAQASEAEMRDTELRNPDLGSAGSVSVVEVQVVRVLLGGGGDQGVGSTISLCHYRDFGESVNPADIDGEFVAFLKKGNDCYDVIYHIRGIARIESVGVNTELIEDQPRFQPLEKFEEKILRLSNPIAPRSPGTQQ